MGYPADMTDTDHRPAEVREQAQQHADQARASMQDKRDKQDRGLGGWVAKRAGEWDLSGQDETTLQRQKFLWNLLVDYWFRMEIDGWENIGESPLLLVGIHSGAPFVWDAWTVGLQWWRRFGPDRPLHGTAHDALMAIPVIGQYFRSMGVLPAAPDAIATALAKGRDVALWPGGEVDSLRPWAERDRANLAGRKGFVKMAIRTGVPIVPIATVGGADAMPVLIRGDRLSRFLRLDPCCGSRCSRWRSHCPGVSHPRRCRSCRCRPRSGPGSCLRSSWTTFPHAQRTAHTSTASTARFKTASSRAWMRWRASVHCRFSHDQTRESPGREPCSEPFIGRSSPSSLSSALPLMSRPDSASAR